MGIKPGFLVLAVVSLLSSGTTRADDDVSDRRVCEAGRPRCVDVVIREMEQRFRKLARGCDHDAVFALVYLRTTETFETALDSLGFADPASVVREDALFADYYFRAFDAFHRRGHGHHGDDPVPPAWQIAFGAAEQRSVTSGGDALLGFDAHIQRDLPFVLYELATRGTPVSHEDHTLVNVFLAEVDATSEVADRFDPTFDDASDPDATFQIIVAWRELAFQNYLRLRDAPTAEARAAVAAEIEAYAAGVAQGIAFATALPPGTDSGERDAYCAAQRCD